MKDKCRRLGTQQDCDPDCETTCVAQAQPRRFITQAQTASALEKTAERLAGGPEQGSLGLVA